MNKSPEEIVCLLKDRFDSNFVEWEKSNNKNLNTLMDSIFTINAIGAALSSRKVLVHHHICLKIFDEIIADISSCIFLSACAIDKPAHIILRRVLELGVASVYLWDMPHAVYGWQEHDQDLSYTEMLKHIASESYITYVQRQNELIDKPCLINYAFCQKVYGNLSDIVHGKINSFETDLPNRFSYDEIDWLGFINLAEKVLEIIINANISRHNLKSEILKAYAKSAEVMK
ncbi:hypothetical protein [Enterobacter sp. 186315]